MNQTFLARLSSATVCLLVSIYKIIFRIFYLQVSICFLVHSGLKRLFSVIVLGLRIVISITFTKLLVLSLETGDVQCRFNNYSNQLLSLYILVLLF